MMNINEVCKESHKKKENTEKFCRETIVNRFQAARIIIPRSDETCVKT